MQSCQSQGCAFIEPNKTKDENPDALNNSPTISANPLINSVESPQINDVEKCKTHSLSTNGNSNTKNNSAGFDSINPIVIRDSISTRNSTNQTNITVNKSINSQPSTSKSKIQYPFISRRGGCLKGNICDYYHPNRINSFKHRQTFNAPKNEVSCPFLRKKGFCKKGITCDFSHNSQTHTIIDDYSRSSPPSNDWSSFLGNLQKSMEKIETIKNRGCSNSLSTNTIPSCYCPPAPQFCQLSTHPTTLVNFPKNLSQTSNGNPISSRLYNTATVIPPEFSSTSPLPTHTYTTQIHPNNSLPTSNLHFHYVPKFLLSNVMSFVPKIDEVQEVVRSGNYQFISLVETWLQNHIHDHVIDIDGYNLIRRDRINGQHGGVCMYIKDSIRFELLETISNEQFEVLWVNLNLPKLPRGYNNLVIGTVYLAMLNYIMNCLSMLESLFSNCAFIILGDFNRLNISQLKSNYGLRQLVNFPTRGRNTLDLVLTNLHEYYDQPSKYAPFGFSDHMSVELKPKNRIQFQSAQRIKIKKGTFGQVLA